jgi:hypothetical protein
MRHFEAPSAWRPGMTSASDRARQLRRRSKTLAMHPMLGRLDAMVRRQLGLENPFFQALSTERCAWLHSYDAPSFAIVGRFIKDA